MLILVVSSSFLPRLSLGKVWKVLVEPNKVYALDLEALAGSTGFLAMEAA